MKNIQKTLTLITEAREYSTKMQKGSVFVTDFKAMQLINCLLKEMQEMLSENLRLEEQLKSEVAFRKTKKED